MNPTRTRTSLSLRPFSGNGTNSTPSSLFQETAGENIQSTRRTDPEVWVGAVALILTILNIFLAEWAKVPKTLLAIQGVLWIGWTAGLSIRLITTLCAFRNRKLHTLAIVAASGALVMLIIHRGKPTENLPGIQDEGYNLATAMALIHRGKPTADVSHLISDNTTPDEAWISMRPTQAQRASSPETIGKRYPSIGFLFFDGQGKDEVRSLFPLAFPMVVAGFGALGGLPLMYWTNTAIWVALASISGLIVCKSRNRRPGVLAFALVLAQPLHLWLSRSAFAELLIALLFMYSVYLWIGSEERGDVGFAFGFASFVCGFLPVVKVEGILPAGVCMGILLVQTILFRKSWTPVLACGAGILIACAALISGGGDYTIDTLRSLPIPSLLWIGLSLIPVSIFLIHSRKTPALSLTTNPGWRWESYIWISLCCACGCAFVWLLWVRPHVAGADTYYYWPFNSEIESLRALTLPRLTWYFTTIGLLLGYAGLWALSLMNRRNPGIILLMSVSLFALFFLAWDIRNNPVQPYAMRRLVSFSTSALCIGISVALDLITAQLPRLRRSLFASSGVISVLIFLSLSRGLVEKDDCQGINAFVSDVSSGIPKGSHLYIPQEGIANELTIPLLLGYGHRVFPLPGKLYSGESLQYRGQELAKRETGDTPSFLIYQVSLPEIDYKNRLAFDNLKPLEWNGKILRYLSDRKPSSASDAQIQLYLASVRHLSEEDLAARKASSTPNLKPSDKPKPKRHEISWP